ncbi:zinc finger protein 845-like [Phymastichus coffea]|uniref:zinc finger protein 845-like n=1 Tax=Phymastichus coffea TaxID=108790 RepID=UPI00273B2183|nr:zinc finger protein 845-like [Phymastichus coffea]
MSSPVKKVRKRRKIVTVPSEKKIYRKLIDRVSYSSYNCDFCDQVFECKPYLRQHIKNECSQKEPFSCKGCWRKYNRLDTLQRHEKYECTNNVRKFICDHCGYRARRKTHLNTHMITRHLKVVKAIDKPDYSISDGIFKCDNCQKTYTRMDTLRRHLFYECGTNRKFSCKQCNASFKRQYHLTLHVKNRHSAKQFINCSNCDKIFTTRRGLEYHRKSRNCELKKLNYQCIFCNFPVKNKYDLDNHLMMHEIEQAEKTNLHQCEICNKMFSTKKSFLYHMKTSCSKDVIFACQACEYSTTLQLEFTKHLEIHHSTTFGLIHTPKETVQLHKCINCSKTFLTQKGLKIHLHTCNQSIIHSSEQQSHIFDKTSNEDNIIISDKSADMITEIKSEESATIAECQKCGKAFTSMEHFNLHLRQNCTENLTFSRDRSLESQVDEFYQCQKCLKTCENLDRYKYHVKFICEKVPNIFCKHCTYFCKVQEDLENHVQNKHNLDAQTIWKKHDYIPLEHSNHDEVISEQQNNLKDASIETKVIPKEKPKHLKRVRCIKINMKKVQEKKEKQEGHISKLFCKECAFTCKTQFLLHNHVMVKHRIRNVYEKNSQN